MLGHKIVALDLLPGPGSVELADARPGAIRLVQRFNIIEIQIGT